MLSLSRFKEQQVVIKTSDGEIVVEVLDVRKDGKVMLGFEADPSIEINRREVHDAKHVGRREP